MEIKAILTGDIVNSEKIDIEQRDRLLQTIQDISNLQPWSPMSIDVYRGDSFQIVVEKPSMALLIATMSRARLISHTPENSPQLWDARISVGIGSVSYTNDRVITSDGEAFRLSGRKLDQIGKGRLAVATIWEDVNQELNVGIPFVDNLLSGLTPMQAQLLYMSVAEQMPQTEIASKLGKLQQSVSKILGAAKENLLRPYLNRFETLISNHINP